MHTFKVVREEKEVKNECGCKSWDGKQLEGCGKEGYHKRYQYFTKSGYTSVGFFCDECVANYEKQ
ncbi:hypothetical protein ACI3ER_11970 [Bacillus sp. Wb]